MLIGIGSKKGVGKDTAANILLKRLNGDKEPNPMDLSQYEIFPFALSVKDISFSLYSWAGLQEPEYYEENTAHKEVMLRNGMTPRDIWIGVGNHLRNFDPNIWLNRIIQSQLMNLIIPDVRFQNEFNAIKGKDGILIKIIRAGQNKGTDPAEISLDNETRWDHVIENNGTLEDLEARLLEVEIG